MAGDLRFTVAPADRVSFDSAESVSRTANGQPASALAPAARRVDNLRGVPARAHIPSAPQYNPLAPTTDPAHPTEVPHGDWDVAVFDNRFPSLADPRLMPPTLIVPTAPGGGQVRSGGVYPGSRVIARCLAARPHLDLLLQVWADRTGSLRGRAGIAYVLPFENRGAEVGVTLHHPHGQIYAYPVIPPVPARMQQTRRRHMTEIGIAACS